MNIRTLVLVRSAYVRAHAASVTFSLSGVAG
jgi:hypothetical protein